MLTSASSPLWCAALPTRLGPPARQAEVRRFNTIQHETRCEPPLDRWPVSDVRVKRRFELRADFSLCSGSEKRQSPQSG